MPQNHVKCPVCLGCGMVYRDYEPYTCEFCGGIGSADKEKAKNAYMTLTRREFSKLGDI